MNPRFHDDELVKAVLEKELQERNGRGDRLHLDQRLNLCSNGGLIVIHYERETGYFRKQSNGPIVAYVRDGKLRDGPEGKIQAELSSDGNCHLPGNPAAKVDLIDYLTKITIPYS